MSRYKPMATLVALALVSLPVLFFSASRFVRDVAYLLSGVGAVAIMFWSIILYKPRRPLVWWLLVSALAITLPGQFISFAERWSSSPIPSDPWSEFLYLVGYLLAVAACLLMIRLHGGKRDWVGVIDAGILVLGAALLAWTFILHPLVSNPHQAFGGLVFPSIYVALDLLLTFLLARLAFAPSKMTATRKLVISCITVLLITDFIFLAMGAPDPSPVWLRPGWILMYLLAAAASAHPSMRRFGEMARSETSPDRMRKVMFVLSLVAAATWGIDSWVQGQKEQAIVMLMVVGSLALFGLRIERMMRLLEDSRSLAERAAREASELAADVAASEEKFRSLIQNANDGVLVVSPDATITYASPACERILGASIEDLVGTQGLSLVDEADLRHATHLLQEALERPGEAVETELRIRHGDGSVRWIAAVGNNLLHVPAIKGLVVNARDVTGRKKLEEELRHQAFFDALTGLANRALLRDRTEHALQTAQRTGATTAIILFDVDDFKHVNDELGHDAGDELLVELANRAKAALRTSDTLGRLGGDEFAILLENLAEERDVHDVADRVLNALRQPFSVRGKDLSVQVSAGVVVVARGSNTVEEVLQNADVAMYEAKRNGKDGYRVFEESMHLKTLERLEIRSQLDRALKEGQFEIYYQPQLDLRSERIVGVEALLRWNHPTRGMVSPVEFIPIAEESGAIVEIGAWVLRESMRQGAAWREMMGESLTISVNVSARQFVGDRLSDELRTALSETSLSGSDVVLEITESVLLDRDEVVLQALDRIDAAGVRLAIDDFGTGYSSLGYLKDLPISILKIDKTFVGNIGGGPEDSAFAEAIIQLARALDVVTLAEGVETPEQVEVLQKLGCELAQGFLFAEPMPASELEGLLGRAHIPVPKPKLSVPS